jgi:hypothetical protein
MLRPKQNAAWAGAALVILLLWQFLTVHYNRGGNWTALFLTGQDYSLPASLARGTYRFPGAGYDGEMYRVIAHDPLVLHDSARYLDDPALRCRRILVPALAYLLVFGHQPWIDCSYIAVIGLFVFLGACWLSRWATLAGVHAAWGLAFLLVPATLISMDRMTVDVALASLTVAFAVHWRNGPWRKVFIVLTLACLVRETGVLLAAGASLFELLQRRWARAGLWGSSALPMLGWYWYLGHVLPEKTRLADKVGPGLFFRILHPPRYPLAGIAETVARWADVLSLAGILLAAILAMVLLLRRWPMLRNNSKGALAICACLYALLVFALGGDQYWIDVNSNARIWSPLLILVALPAIAQESGRGFPVWLGLAPAIAVDLRLGLEFVAEIGGVMRGLF